VTEWAIQVHHTTGQKPEIDAIKNYRSGDFQKFEFMADTFFCAGFGSVQFRGLLSRILISDFITEFDEAFIVAILHNGFDRWAQEAAIIASGGEVNSKKLEKE
jgi:hypothetical protein